MVVKHSIELDIVLPILFYGLCYYYFPSKYPQVSPSSFQQTIHNLLLKILKDAFIEKLIVEHPIGAYSLDIAFLEQDFDALRRTGQDG